MQRCTRRIELFPLSPGTVAVMAGGSGLDAAELYQATGGNPFYVAEVLQTGLDRVPPSARDAVLARAARLGPAACGVLDVAALIGSTVEPWLLERAAASSPEMVDRLAESGLLTAAGPELRFRHEIARRAVEEAIPRHRRPAIHARIMAALGDTGCSDHARLAYYAEESGDGPAALHHATLAGRQAVELGSHREAAAQFERALRFAGGEPPEALAARYDELADELCVIDNFGATVDAYQRALELWRQAGDRLREGDALRRGAGALWRLCRGREAAAASAAALRILEPLGPTVELAQAFIRAAGDRLRDLQFEQASELARAGHPLDSAGQRTAAREHPLSLTRREQEVLDLICASRTNGEIAAQLVISAKTVDHHVSAVLAKLGVPTRRAAAEAAARAGVSPAPRDTAAAHGAG